MTELKKYFEPLENINYRDYPIPENELFSIVSQVMEGVSIVKNKIEYKYSTLSQTQQSSADSFLYYVGILKKHNVSPISLSVFLPILGGQLGQCTAPSLDHKAYATSMFTMGSNRSRSPPYS